MSAESAAPAAKMLAGRPVSVLAARTCLICLICLCSGVPGSHGNEAHAGPDEHVEASRGTLAIIRSYSLPIAEVSGLTRIRGSSMAAGKGSGGIGLYAVGDASYEVVYFRAAGSLDAPDIQVRDTAPLLGKHADKASQWEAVAADAAVRTCTARRASAWMLATSDGLPIG